MFLSGIYWDLFYFCSTLMTFQELFPQYSLQITLRYHPIIQVTLIQSLVINVERSRVFFFQQAVGKFYLKNYILFSNRKIGTGEHRSILRDDAEIECRSSGNFLVINVDTELKFNKHINSICRKVSKLICIPSKLQPLVPESLLRNLYFSFVYPNLIYCNIVWGGTFSVYPSKLVSLWKRVLRKDHTGHLFQRTRILKFVDLHNYFLALHAFKLKKRRDLPLATHTNLPRNRDSLVDHFFHRLTLTRHAVSYTAPQVWNSLPPDLKNCNSINQFKSALQDYFITSYSADVN